MTDLDLSQFAPQGATVSTAHDHARLSRQQQVVWECMRDGEWRTLRELSEWVHAPEASVSARLRERKMGLTVARRRRGDPKLGIHEYRVLA